MMQHGSASKIIRCTIVLLPLLTCYVAYNIPRGRYAFVDCEPTYCIIGGLLFVPFSYAVCTLPFPAVSAAL